MDDKAMVKLFHALRDETRLEILRHLAAKERTVTELTGLVSMGQSGVSRQLKILSEAKLVQRKNRGRYTYYMLAPLGEVPRPFVILSSYLLGTNPWPGQPGAGGEGGTSSQGQKGPFDDDADYANMVPVSITLEDYLL